MVFSSNFRDSRPMTREHHDLPSAAKPAAALRAPDTSLGYRLLLVLWLTLCLVSYVHYRVLTGAHENSLFGLLKFSTCYYLWLPLTPLLFHLERRFPVTRPFSPRHALLLLLIGLPLCYGLSLATLNTLPLLHACMPRSVAAVPFTLHVRATEGELQAVLYLITMGVSAFLRYREEQRAQEQQAARLLLQRAELEAALRQAELETLRMRLNPHFLFNCLQNISSLTAEDPGAASTMLARLGDLLRVALSNDYRKEIPLRDEIALLRSYLAIEQVRFGSRLSVLFALDPAADAVPVPSLLLQPLIENALKHGLYGCSQGLISIGSTLEAGALILTIRDNGIGLHEDRGAPAGFGIGLSATRDRLLSLYGDRQRLDLRTLPEGGTEVRVVLPATPTEPAQQTTRATHSQTPATATPGLDRRVKCCRSACGLRTMRT